MWSGVGAVINVEDNSSVLLAPQGVVNKLPEHFFRSRRSHHGHQRSASGIPV
uniref:Uncharacterized protein n=1 Tax=Klebsiella pneumoniae TaxID=573 RepID=A0A8B0SRB1_KLEPN|nr:hypothetical protein [Klebsiella pneumoniae]